MPGGGLDRSLMERSGREGSRKGDREYARRRPGSELHGAQLEERRRERGQRGCQAAAWIGAACGAQLEGR